MAIDDDRLRGRSGPDASTDVRSRRADRPHGVFITGASTGVGAALARHYGALGAAVGLFARRHDALAALLSTLPSDRASIFPGDVRDAAALRRAAGEFISRFGAPDIVIANAGVSLGAVTDRAEDLPTFRTVLDTNVVGMVHTFAPFLASMHDAGHGTLVGIASIAGFRGLAGSGAYSASKAAAIAYLESLRLEQRGSGIAVVTICPGYIATPMTSTNPYPMPFLIDADKAARLIARAIERRKRFYVLPWQMAILGRLLRVLPRPIYDAVFARAPRKARHANDG
ncbi:MAG: SDR family oxidoreductase [Betaproteobacteria bacterium]